jgi:hypothetical protein
MSAGRPYGWFSLTTPFGRSREVRRLLEPWALEADVLVAKDDDDFVVALDLPLGEEKEAVVSAVLQRLKKISVALSPLTPAACEGQKRSHSESVSLLSGTPVACGGW